MVQQSLIIDHGWLLVQRNGMGWFKVGAMRWDGQPVQQCCNNGWCNETDRQLVYNDMGRMLQQCLVQRDG